MTKQVISEFKDSPRNIRALFITVDEAMELQDCRPYDFRVGKLKVKSLISSIMFTLLVGRECSQREIARVLGSSAFAYILNGGRRIKTDHSAISHRLDTLSPAYAKNMYNSVYKSVTEYYTPQELGGFNVVAEDSTLVTETSARLSEGLECGRNRNAIGQKSQRQVKYTMGYDGIGAAFVDLFTEQSYLSENKALFTALTDNIKSAADHRNLYVFDRGLNSSLKLNSLAEDEIYFVGRMNLGRKYETVEERPVSQLSNGCVVESDVLARLQVKGKTPEDAPVLRIINVNVGKSVMARKGHRNRMEDSILLVTDAVDLSEEEIIEAYRLRWEIEVYFKILKQNLSFSHFVSVNKSGLETIMYCVLTLSLLLLLYSRVSDNGVKGAIFDLKLQLLEVIWESEIQIADLQTDQENCDS